MRVSQFNYKGGAIMKSIIYKYTGVFLFTYLMVSTSTVAQSDELVDSMKVVIDKISITNPHPDLDKVYVRCSMSYFPGLGKPAVSFYFEPYPEIKSPFNTANVIMEKKFSKPILLTQNNYTVDCQLTAREKGTSGLERTVALMASEPWAKAVKCNPGDGGKSLAGACYAQKTIAVKK
jgi:hypothetical protein